MAQWLSLSDNFGEKPIEQRIFYEREVSWPWEENPVKAFLVEYKMSDGLEGIGLAGPTTWSFVGIDDWKALAPEDLIYCYVGWYIQFFFINLEGHSQKDNPEKANQFVAQLIQKGEINSNIYKICDILKVAEDLTYYAIETIKNGEPVYLVGAEDDYTFYKKDLPPMQLPPLFYFLGKTFNPFRKV